VYLSPANRAICEAHHRYSLPFPPPAEAISLVQAFKLTDGLANGNGLNIRKLTNNLKMHALAEKIPTIKL
jgi:hypothetical protein